ncbi:5'-nucleotidase domain-containing protein 4 isoform X3 [Triticum urartu]|uniref:5'-nucleotidase domain-containing protein 4 isoform X3 n=1 Tax=Triticum urartu TaxID=4572 RepID=UPI002044C458|nr:5'-nucleotidase domain-containing protein 4 isoform X3 [Triticum urartu]
MLSRRPLAAALRLAPLSPPLLLFFASSSSSCSSPTASASAPRGCSALRMDSGAVEPASTGAIWSTPSVEPRSISIGKQIFCNRSLNMRNITAVGFDMDYTLAQYKPETFEALAYHGTIEKLVKDLNYPEELLTWQFDWKYMVRGLVLDKKRGNILKMDRHKYVKVAYHGFREMSKEEKVAAYGSTLIRDSFDEPDYALIDTLFSLGEAYLFAQLVDFMDSNPAKVPSGTDYAHMYRDVRSAVDLCHRDGTLKRMVAKEPSRYINEDLAIVPMLQMLRKSGRSTFLVTNSLWDYTDVVMNYLCGPYMSDVSSSHNHKWLEYFDVVITGSSKPSFFHDDNRTGLFEVEPDSGKLLNADLQIGSPRSSQHQPKPIHKVYQGGNVGHLHRLLSVASSSQILYVGDHIYGDILRSKKVLGWRTMLVIPELEQEVKLQSESKSTRKELRHLRMERDSVEDTIHRLEWSLQRYMRVHTAAECELLCFIVGRLEMNHSFVASTQQLRR